MFSLVICNKKVNTEWCSIMFQGCAQVSLADFSPESVSVKWYNILSFRFMQPPSDLTSTNSDALPLTQLSIGNSDIGKEPHPMVNNRDEGKSHDEQESEVFVFNKQVASIKEESSDDSTVISSQTSTLTRNQGTRHISEGSFFSRPCNLFHVTYLVRQSCSSWQHCKSISLWMSSLLQNVLMEAWKFMWWLYVEDKILIFCQIIFTFIL